jgi:uncharacterized membrane protein
MAFSASISIDASAHQVWTVMSDVERWSTWTASITSVERLDPGPFRVGSRARVRHPRLPTVVWTVTDLQPDRSFTWQVVSPGVTSIAEHSIAPGPGNLVTVTLSIRQTGLLGPLFAWLYAGLTVRYLNLEVEGLKRRTAAGALAPVA